MPRILDWKFDRICLDLFYTSDIKRMICICYCYSPETWTHPELVAAWADAVPLLPNGVKEVWLDVTPAPRWAVGGDEALQFSPSIILTLSVSLSRPSASALPQESESSLSTSKYKSQ